MNRAETESEPDVGKSAFVQPTPCKRCKGWDTHSVEKRNDLNGERMCDPPAYGQR